MLTVGQFGRDHASLLAYIETLVVDTIAPAVDGRRVGEIDKRRVRCNPANGRGHPHAPFPWQDSHGTRLADGTTRAAHDDWDCLDELEAAGFVEVISTANGFVTLTDSGRGVVERLRRFKASGGAFVTFDWRRP